MQILALRLLLSVTRAVCMPALLYIVTKLDLEVVDAGKRWYEGMDVCSICPKQPVAFQLPRYVWR